LVTGAGGVEAGLMLTTRGKPQSKREKTQHPVGSRLLPLSEKDVKDSPITVIAMGTE